MTGTKTAVFSRQHFTNIDFFFLGFLHVLCCSSSSEHDVLPENSHLKQVKVTLVYDTKEKAG